MKFQNKTILITGASSGIGKDFALKVASEGATVFLASRNTEKLNNVKLEVEKLGGAAIVIKCDVSQPDQVREMFLEVTKGGKVLDLVLNNAGLGHIGNIYDLTVDQINQIIDVNIRGMIMVSKFASEVFVRQKSGHLIMTSSLAGLITLPQWSVYVASKWAITGFADCIRFELKPHNVKVTTIHPGAVKTEFFDPDKANIDISKMGGDAIDVREVSDAIYNAAFTNKQKVVLPAMSRNFSMIYKYAPSLVGKMMEKLTSKVEYHNKVEEDEPEFSYIHTLNDNSES